MCLKLICLFLNKNMARKKVQERKNKWEKDLCNTTWEVGEGKKKNIFSSMSHLLPPHRVPPAQSATLLQRVTLWMRGRTVHSRDVHMVGRERARRTERHHLQKHTRDWWLHLCGDTWRLKAKLVPLCWFRNCRARQTSSPSSRTSLAAEHSLLAPVINSDKLGENESVNI